MKNNNNIKYYFFFFLFFFLIINNNIIKYVSFFHLTYTIKKRKRVVDMDDERKTCACLFALHAVGDAHVQWIVQ